MMMMMIAARQPAAPGTGPAATAPGRWRRTGSGGCSYPDLANPYTLWVAAYDLLGTGT